MNSNVQALLARIQDTADFGSVRFESINETNALGDNALHCVCVWGDLEAARLLVENGIDLHQKGEFGFTPLRVAAEFGHPLIVQYLISVGADPSALTSPEVFDRDALARHLNTLEVQVQRLEDQVAQYSTKLPGEGS